VRNTKKDDAKTGAEGGPNEDNDFETIDLKKLK